MTDPNAPPAIDEAGLDAMETIFRMAHNVRRELSADAHHRASDAEVAVLACEERLARRGFAWDMDHGSVRFADHVYEREA